MREPLSNLETLRDDAEALLFRTVRDGERFLVFRPTANEGAIGELENALALRADLDPTWAARPRALTEHLGRPALLVEDPGGDLGSRRTGLRDLGLLLRIATGAVSALRELHARGIVHRDVRPANLFTDERGEVHLFGFGAAARATARPSEKSPIGALPYSAPEQLGQAERAADARSDLYALGISLFELASGATPFAASDAREWIHAHLAKRPPELEDVPAVLAAIVAKLLSKSPGDRYQTAAGLEADLARCLAAWDRHGRIDPFPLGQLDLPEWIRLGDQLYGRSSYRETIRSAVDRVVGNGAPELVLIAGPPGIGKSALARTLLSLSSGRAFFATGKPDQYRLDVPYTALAQALEMLVRDLLAKSDGAIAETRRALLGALGPSGQLIVNLVPDLELIIGEQPPVPDLPPNEARLRFQEVFRRMLAVFARRERPLILFLDDMQWADPATIDLIASMFTAGEIRDLLVVGAYRDSDPGKDALLGAAEAIKSTGGTVLELTLPPISQKDLVALVSDALHSEPARVEPLSRILHDKTGGNPFFVLQFLRALAEDQLLAFDRSASVWTWDLERIKKRDATDNVVDLVTRRLERLSKATLGALEKMAGLGHVVKVELLAAASGLTEEALDSVLSDAIMSGLVVREKDEVAFVHDRVQEAAYASIPEPERAPMHLRLGRLIWSRTCAEEITLSIFEIADQLARGAQAITERTEQIRAAELELAAGRRARATTAHAAASVYLRAARTLLGDGAWDEQYALTFAVELLTAECEYLDAPAAASERLERLLGHAIGLVDQAAVVSLWVSLLTMMRRFDKAIEVGVAYLLRTRIAWPSRPTEEDVVAAYARTRTLLGRRSIESLVDAPNMTDPVSRAVMDVLVSMEAVAHFTSSVLLDLVVLSMINLSLEHGHTDGSCLGYGEAMFVVGPRFMDLKTALQFSQLGMMLVERGELGRYKARVYLLSAYYAVPWLKPVRESTRLVERSFDSAREAGDRMFAIHAATHLVATRLAQGDRLSDVEREAENSANLSREARYSLMLECNAGPLVLVARLRGRTPAFKLIDADDERSLERRLAEDPSRAIAACWYWIRKLQAHVLAEEVDEALAATSNAERFLWTTPGGLELIEYHFFGALAKAASGDRNGIEPHRAKLAEWTEVNPETFASRLALVDAEIFRLDGRELDAERTYERAIDLAKEHELVHHEGLASSIAARFHGARGLSTIADAYRRNARSCYLRWGADALVKRLEARHPELKDRFATEPEGSLLGKLDLATVIDISQALSGEIIFEKLLGRLMTLAVEYAGADRGLLITIAGVESRVSAEAVAQPRQATVRLVRRPVVGTDLPTSIINYVIRTQEVVLLRDARDASTFSSDEYVRTSGVRSVLCLPLIKQRQLVGVLYLENKLTPDAFASERREVLRLVASQAAISLETARLYAELRSAGSYLREAQQLSHTGSFGWRPSSGEIVWSDETFAIFEYALGVTPTIEMVLARVHPDDRERVKAQIDRLVLEPADWELEHRLLTPNGSIKHLHVVSRAGKSTTGEVEYFGAVMDVTTAKLAERSLEESKVLQLAYERFALALKGSNVGVWDFDLRNHALRDAPVHHVNLWEPLGYEADASGAETRSNRYHPERWHPGDREAVRIALDAFIGGRGETFEHEWRLLHKDGSYRWWLNRGAAVRDTDGRALRFVGSSIDITDRKRLEEEVVRAKDAAEAANLAKDHFMANVSHEIRTPMNAILGMTELVLDSSLTEQQRLALSTAKTAAEGLVVIIDDLLDFAKIRAGKIALASEPFSLRSVVRDAARPLALRAHQKGLELIVDVSPDLADDRVGDAAKLRQVLLNLIGNAIKFTARGEVVVSVGAAHEADVRFAIRDTGIGIAHDKQDAIFEAFEQADGSTTRRFGGTGLGLTIAARLVELMGGRIELESEPGRGSTFSFIVRIERAEPVRSPAGTLDRGPATTARPRALRVLIAEDNAPNQELLRMLLASRGHEVVAVSDGREALAELERSRFDVLLLDVHLPEMDGFDVTETIRRRERGSGRHLHVIATTARSRPEDREAALATGMDAFMTKPIASSDLWAAIDRVRPSLIDAPVLLAAVGGDREALRRISEGFEGAFPEQLSAVKRGFERKSARELREAAHKLAGLVSTFSTEAGAVVLELEDRAERGDLDVSDLVERLVGLAPDLMREVGAVTLESLERHVDTGPK